MKLTWGERVVKMLDERSGTRGRGNLFGKGSTHVSSNSSHHIARLADIEPNLAALPPDAASVVTVRFDDSSSRAPIARYLKIELVGREIDNKEQTT